MTDWEKEIKDHLANQSWGHDYLDLGVINRSMIDDDFKVIQQSTAKHVIVEEPRFKETMMHEEVIELEAEERIYKEQRKAIGL